MRLLVAPYREQQARQWETYPRSVQRHLDRRLSSVSARHGSFGGEFSLTRMSWIKPGFLWMAFRSNWGASRARG